MLRTAWIIIESILFALGLFGIPDDVANLNAALQKAQPIFNDGAFQLVVLTVAFALLLWGLTRWGHLTIPLAPFFSGPAWAERRRLEIQVIVNVAADRAPYAVPIAKEPELSYLRNLKDDINDGHLTAEYEGDKPDANAAVTLEQLQIYENKFPHRWLRKVIKKWRRVQQTYVRREDNYTVGDEVELELAKEILNSPALEKLFLDLVEETAATSGVVRLPWKQRPNGGWKYLGSSSQASAEEKGKLKALKWLLRNGCAIPVSDVSDVGDNEWWYMAAPEAASMRSYYERVKLNAGQ